MAKLYSALPFALLLFCTFSYSQKKILQASPATQNITINGQADEPIWATAQVATDFVMFEPDNGKPIGPEKRTEVRILYDDAAIYVSALMYDNEPNKILKEITERDEFGTAEHFGIFINGYNDGQQDFRFFVSASGVQQDCVAQDDASGIVEDYSWNAIWDSEVKITDFGWVVEMKIPYAALRFSNEARQTWGLNMYREIRRDRQKYTWSYLNANISAEIQQAGILEGIENIKTPTRLFFIPYSSYYYDYSEGESQHRFKGGMDIKYGISDSFTLDAILVPDFGQTRFDNVILNLTPFEQQFNENRPFFTEGIDIFNKGNLLYSRRIGGAPSTSPIIRENEEVENLPNTVDLINAIKFSGRTKDGLGIGVLNAVTEKTYATIRNTATQQTRDVIVEPMVNYNLIVLDQRFNKNSSVSLVNSNVARDGNFRDANVTGIVWDLNTKENTYKLTGDFKYSHINDIEDYNGFKTALNFVKTSGKHRFDVFAKYLSAQYDINDLGINFQNNYHNFYANYNYRILNPEGRFNSFRFDATSNVEIENVTGKFQNAYSSLTVSATTNKINYYNLGLQVNPIETFDFYQPQTSGRYSYVPKGMNAWFLYSSNYNKTLAIDVRPTVYINDEDRNGYALYVGPRYRISDKILLIYGLEFSRNYNDRGLGSGQNTSEIIFVQRNLQSIVSELSGRYSVNNRMTFNLTARYYWSYSENDRLFTLSNDGYLNFLSDDPALTSAYDQNLNLWNFDLSYSWWFAPASQISVLYRNSAIDFRNEVNRNFNTNFTNLFSNSVNTVFSVSVRYFIDYNSLKNNRRVTNSAD
ncbi:MAG TPA: DUF5916 domain-containing protein [Flavobacterium sp.]|jgi:hypothetical protein